MGFENGGELAHFIANEAGAAPHARRLLAAMPKDRQEEAIKRCAAAFEAAANLKGGHKLLDCSVSSVIRAVLWCAVTDLYPGGLYPQCYPIPYGQNLDMMVSWRGLKVCAERSGNTNLRIRPVFQGEDFEAFDGTDGEGIHHQRRMDVDRDWDHLVGCYVIGTTPTGQVTSDILGKREIEKRRDNSAAVKSGGQTPWNDWPVEMALKTALRYSISRGTFPVVDRFELALADADIPRDQRPVHVIDAVTIEKPTGAAGYLADHGDENDVQNAGDKPKAKDPVPAKAANDNGDDGGGMP